MSETTVQSVDRALTLLEVLSDHEEGLGITEISTKIELHKSTVHRLLGTLINKGYVKKVGSGNKYKLTMKLFELGRKTIEKVDVIKVSRPYLEELRDSIKEVVHLVVQDGADIVYVDKVESENTIRMHSSIGKRSPMYCTSVGKALMAHMEDDEIENIWSDSNIVAYTEHTIISFEDMKAEIEKIRNQGYSVDEQENEIGVRCVGAAILDHTGSPVAAISVSGPTNRITKEKVEEIAKIAIGISEKISYELGYKKI